VAEIVLIGQRCQGSFTVARKLKDPITGFNVQYRWICNKDNYTFGSEAYSLLDDTAAEDE
jgi:hypothetical protein